MPALFRLLGGSAFLSDVLIREGEHWPKLFLRQTAITQKSAADHLNELDLPVKNAASFDEFCAALRRHKQREYLRIGARDLSPGAKLEETVRELTALAEACLEASYRRSRTEVENDYGALHLTGSTEPNRFVVLGMGKLGGGELNFSSDIDVIFLYESDEGETSGGNKRALSARQFFTEIGQRIIQAMGKVSEDGFVFRTDLRLRPLGANGPLVQSVGSAMLYYESWGQCWERAALIKARPVAGARDLGHAFLKEVEPFVYRRYLDFTTVDELRHMKTRIENELLGVTDKERNVKLGVGGIREIEFFTQALQLVNGGYEIALRTPSTLPALAELARRELISKKERDSLTEAYRFLRQVEHKVQIVQEAHAHSIPAGKEEEQALARRLGYRRRGRSSEREQFWRDYRRQTRNVRNLFDRLFYSAQKEIEHEAVSTAGSVWNDLDRREIVLTELANAGFSDPTKAYEQLLAIRDGEVYAPPSPRRLKVMRLLGPALMAAITESSAPERALLNLAEFSHRIGGRTGFLTLLAENPETMRLLITLFAESQFLTDLFLNRPELIDTLIRVDLTRIDKSRTDMLAELRAALADQDDIEARLNALRRYKTEEFIRIGLHDLGGALELVQVLAQLSKLADACLQAAVDLTFGELEEKYGGVPDGRFTVIGGGKLGGRELDYNSDLDLIFIYHAAPEATSGKGLPAHEYYVRAGQKLLTYLGAPTEEGIAYKVDMQLRPSGKAGPLVSSLEAFREYHRTSSQLWERQALIKTRHVAGDAALGREVEKITRAFAYARPLLREEVGEIHHLRMRMERELAGEGESRFNLKKGRGGLVDIEFLTQMLQLTHGHRCPKLRRRETLVALQMLHQEKILKKREYSLLADGYLFLRRLDHRLRLERDQSIDAFDADPEKLQSIGQALGYDGAGPRHPTKRASAGAKLLREYQTRREQIRTCYERYFLPNSRPEDPSGTDD
ncbi:MAG TPA: bifunctional [glutamate--ammonia ligase]-adenylyl-L-tyrosine phosphorylase/[glutamate--ammonia-ligase] adenylyltransferase [Candidatus Binatia bacterium]|nr:bifunctional [glutamate--ammonia ligase]-adenylyl-L-tyrosine phosphorylase/[glutamate--ammonia-ligase] adenylyltransferase [Candidatus Binatia bacterium]